MASTSTSGSRQSVSSCGAKTAAKWLNLYGTADELVDKAEEISGKVGESLRDNVDKLRLSRELATIRLDIDLPVSIDSLEPAPADVDKLRDLYSRFELRTLLRQLDEQAGEPAPAVETSDCCHAANELVVLTGLRIGEGM